MCNVVGNAHLRSLQFCQTGGDVPRPHYLHISRHLTIVGLTQLGA